MGNRFVALIKSGAIESVEALKAEFKALAKLTHPDLAGPGSTGEEFIRARREYESALRDFGRHRFGFSGAEPAGRAPSVLDRRTLYAGLAALLGRGFPKKARHEKESKRYAYGKHLVMAQLGVWKDGRARLFEAFEAGLLELKRGDPRRCEAAMDLLRSVLDYHTGGPELARAAIELDLQLWKKAGGPGPVAEFLELLVEDLSRGQALR
ncbi:MAG TPA: hypothetical protein VFL04_03265 [Rectinemataceae bacterium]|nr:hypothetical protein [Rectinemataceae bacterium]